MHVAFAFLQQSGGKHGYRPGRLERVEYISVSGAVAAAAGGSGGGGGGVSCE